MSPALLARIERAEAAPPSHREVAAWVFLADAGNRDPVLEREAIDARARQLSSRTLARRARALPPGTPLVDRRDLPLDPAHLRAIEATGARLRARSRWLRAVSVRADRAALLQIAALPMVTRLEAVGLRAPERSDEHDPHGTIDTRGVRAPHAVERAAGVPDYGPSHAQLAIIQVPELHALGFSGAGIRIAILDSGFNLDHPAFASLHIVGARDFIHGDSVVTWDPAQDSFDQTVHGTKTLSLLAANAPGQLIGPAYNAEILLAKTEEVPTETPVEEDWWVEGIEWADSAGADIVSSSLGYVDWDDGTGYTYDDLDGDTAVTTIAADHAAYLGIFVANAAGNGGLSGFIHPPAPADGDSVCAVGAVNMSGTRAAFSSVGPPGGTPERVKPDVMAPGVGVWWATGSGASAAFGNAGAGTSFSTPLVAGAAALLMEANPAWQGQGPVLLEALRATGSRATDPDSLMGFGIVCAWDALVAALDPGGPGGALLTLEAFPNPAAGQLTIQYDITAGVAGLALPLIEIFDVHGRKVTQLAATTDPGRLGGSAAWQGVDAEGKPVPAGVYFVRATMGSYDARTPVVMLR